MNYFQRKNLNSNYTRVGGNSLNKDSTMGTWGTGLSSNDTFADVYGEFFELYNEGQDVKEITAKLLKNNNDLLADTGDSNNFWFAIAKAQWECKSLSKEVIDKVEEIIKSKRDLEVWKDLGADEGDIQQRDKVLIKFLEQLREERLKPRSRKKRKIFKPVFAKGDCLTFKLLNGNFGAALVLEAIYDTPYGFNLVAVTTINKNGKPSVEEVRESRVLCRDTAVKRNMEQLTWFVPNYFEKDRDKFEVIGKISVSRVYNPKTDFVSGAGDWFTYIIELASEQDEFSIMKWFTRGRKIKTYL